jgi:hypothetical protein
MEHSFGRSTTASDCCDANQGGFDGWAPPTMDELDAFEREVDNAKEALASKLAVILFMECKARIYDWSDRDLMLRLALVSSLEEGRDDIEEGSDDGGVDSKLAVILLQLIEVDADESAEVAYEDMMEVFATLDVAMAVAAAAAAAAEATLRVALILFCLLRIAMPSRKTSGKSFTRQMSSLSWRELGLSILHFRAR